MIDLSQILNDEIAKIDRWIKQAANERDESATPTESTHDQTRQIANQLFNSLLEEKARLIKLTNIAKHFKTVYTVEDKNAMRYKFMLVPDGLGGKNIEETVLVGESSLLGQKLKGLKEQNIYEINGSIFTVVAIES